eukprot:scaffold125866_cov57-Phaeocystis_antarctica.AAC.3
MEAMAAIGDEMNAAPREAAHIVSPPAAAPSRQTARAETARMPEVVFGADGLPACASTSSGRASSSDGELEARAMAVAALAAER